MVLRIIHNNDIRLQSGKRSKSSIDHNLEMSNEPKQIKYDHERAGKCVQDNWMGPIHCFPDKSFERTFWITRSMVDMLVNHLAKRFSFWRQAVCCAGKPTICPYVKFLTAMKMICSGVSGNTFVDYFQMGESPTRRCIAFPTKGLVHCHALADIYLQRPSRSDARKIVALHERVHKIPGMMGSYWT